MDNQGTNREGGGSRQSMTPNIRTFLVVACIIGGVVFGISQVLFPTVMKKTSPDKQHTAKLRRTKGIDVNYHLIVDGKSVFRSADFAPRDADFREQIAWDTNSRNVLLEIGGERIFGYDAVAGKPLTNSELLNVQLTPFSELGYEYELPRESLSK